MACFKAHITMMPALLKASIKRASSVLSIGISRVKIKLCLSVVRPNFVVRANLFKERLKAEASNITPMLNVSCNLFCDVVTQYYIKVTPKEEQYVSNSIEYKVLSNVDWEVSANVEWIQLRKGSDYVSALLDINAGLDRDGTIKFIGRGISVTRKVLQSGMREVFNEDFILADGGTFNVYKK